MSLKATAPLKEAVLKSRAQTMQVDVTLTVNTCSGVLGGFNPHPKKFLSFDKAEPNSQFRGKYILYNLIGIRFSLICK
jgi:hypothetical protein